jgi:hypothetical protein
MVKDAEKEIFGEENNSNAGKQWNQIVKDCQTELAEITQSIKVKII